MYFCWDRVNSLLCSKGFCWVPGFVLSKCFRSVFATGLSWIFQFFGVMVGAIGTVKLKTPSRRKAPKHVHTCTHAHLCPVNLNSTLHQLLKGTVCVVPLVTRPFPFHETSRFVRIYFAPISVLHRNSDDAQFFKNPFKAYCCLFGTRTTRTNFAR